MTTRPVVSLLDWTLCGHLLNTFQTPVGHEMWNKTENWHTWNEKCQMSNVNCTKRLMETCQIAMIGKTATRPVVSLWAWTLCGHLLNTFGTLVGHEMWSETEHWHTWNEKCQRSNVNYKKAPNGTMSDSHDWNNDYTSRCKPFGLDTVWTLAEHFSDSGRTRNVK